MAHINLYLSSMSLFPAVNAIYNTFFGPSPPTRACVSALLPRGLNIKMDVIAHTSNNKGSRTALHVRGLSYWAPANIGPYSQSVKVGERLFIAGQIGLQPYDLTLPSPQMSSSFAAEAALSSQHVRRIVKAMQEGTGGGFGGWMESCICWISGPSATWTHRRDLARMAWRLWVKNEEIPFLIVQTEYLPKGAQIEWQVTWQTGRRAKTTQGEEDDDEDDIVAVTESTCEPSIILPSRASEGIPDTLSLPSSTLAHPGLSTQTLRSGTSSVSITCSTGGGVSMNTSKDAFSRRTFFVEESDVQLLRSDTPGTTIKVLNIANLVLDDVAVASVDLCES